MLLSNRSGVSLIELVFVVVIVGILATLAVTHYGSYRESVLDDEAIANLKLMAAAERIYRMEEGNYYPYSAIGRASQNIVSILNANLKLSLTVNNWIYMAATDHSVNPPKFFVCATRADDSSNKWQLWYDEEEPIRSNCTW